MDPPETPPGTLRGNPPGTPSIADEADVAESLTDDELQPPSVLDVALAAENRPRILPES